MREIVYPKTGCGFSLIELMFAVAVLSFGLLAVGQLFYVAASSGSLSGAKGSAAVAAQNMLESLADLYARDPASHDLAFGAHGSRQMETANPADGSILSRYDISWTVDRVNDPRPGKVLDAKLVKVTVVPIKAAGIINNRPPFNKTLSVSTIFSTKMQ
jgi:prepilin-type N-terminal cleavage/methylation domain-containing protein